MFHILGGDGTKWLAEEVFEDLWDGDIAKIGDGMADFVEVGLGYRFSNLFFKGGEYVLFEEEAIVPLDVLLT